MSAPDRPKGEMAVPQSEATAMNRPPRFPLALDRLGAQIHQPAKRPASASPRPASPSGLGLDSAAVRERMVQRLRAGGLGHERVLLALAAVERHLFVDSALATQAYEDTSLPIGLSQTISKPSVVGHMLALLHGGAQARETGNLGRVLEIGTGCGYQTALLMHLAGQVVVSIERLQGLHDKARANLASLRQAERRLADVRLVFGDGRLGHAPRAPYQSIIAAAGGENVPSAWTDQLAVGGRLIAPVQAVDGQHLVIIDRDADGLRRFEQDVVKFVPLKSGTA
jgi:protein-L-isoaspartate(D-aspartate) O-methyltransferase